MINRFALLAPLFLVTAAIGQTTQPADVSLGEMFQSRLAGIQFRPPDGGTLVRQVNSGDIIRFIYPNLSWDLKAKIISLSKPVPLTLAPTPDHSGGLLEMTVAELQDANPSAEITLQEVREFGQYQVGVIAARFNTGTTRALTQQAIFRASDELYYVLQLSSPARAKASTAGDDDPREVLAVHTFEKVLNTVKLLDRQAVKQEQDQRLYNTRQLFTAWDEKRLRNILIPEQYLRVVRDGKEVGFVKVNERVTDHSGREGLEVEMHSHVVAEPDPAAKSPEDVGGAIDRLSRLFVTFDRYHEDWSTVTVLTRPSMPPASTTELGNSDMLVKRMLDREKAAQMWKDASKHDQPPVVEKQDYSLSVSQYSQIRSNVPVERKLPPFYLPQALGQLLPRLVPLDEPNIYMFVSYVSDQKEVMTRYVDVLAEQEVSLDGARVHAVAVKDRIGLEGSVTTHYMTRDGRWLGSVNEDQKLSVLPGDKETIEQNWKTTTPATQPAGPPMPAQVR